ncbi:hypothetical protein [Acaryochloris marina]|uniref:hypothetical protein n=1 Tax=Acaryochloris marina TaxID=155978 RepID=UPI001BB0B333|nr:hypothetical protein [Acaryochloris marina]QUY40418.1 hypothetical protein I1H34_00695 [Acaryochloris marina S15]
MSQDDMFQKLVKTHRKSQPQKKQATTPKTPRETKRRGRPANGKRSDPNWIGRTYYVQTETDLDVEEQLLKLKREGKELDKSELVDALLGAWVKWRQGEDSEILIGEISPRQI